MSELKKDGIRAIMSEDVERETIKRMAAKPKVLNRAIIKTTPEGAVYVGRPSKWGNPFVIGKDGTRDEVVAKYRAMVNANPQMIWEAKQELQGKNLVCWCAPLACHADVLLEIANSREAKQ